MKEGVNEEIKDDWLEVTPYQKENEKGYYVQDVNSATTSKKEMAVIVMSSCA